MPQVLDDDREKETAPAIAGGLGLAAGAVVGLVIGGAAAGVYNAFEEALDPDAATEGLLSAELCRIADDERPRLKGQPSPEAQSHRKYAELLARSLSVYQTARLLGQSLDVILGSLSARRIYGIYIGGQWRVPRI